jgi:hypothetical protein
MGAGAQDDPQAWQSWELEPAMNVELRILLPYLRGLHRRRRSATFTPYVTVAIS